MAAPPKRALPSGIRRLSAREREVAQLISQASSNRDIARALGISEKTVEHHLTTIFQKVGVHSRTELALHYLESRDAERSRRQ